MLQYNKNLKKNAQRLRKNATETEILFWSQIRKKQILGFQFYRQKPIGSYIVDFFCPSAKLVIEIDGSQHFEKRNEEQDKKRDMYLESLGLKVLRFNNLDICQNIDGAVQVVYNFLKKIRSLSS
ncbi:endonuclease domain-containing protein [Candidatus Gracilibacteria bacterium]|nr:endonuclease domain-containing protein [Candidatus Gracilibacteria bacterium]MCF7819569.1 endonuclease domain-containing protein [Candidatus Gracilibacteria bacterium]